MRRRTPEEQSDRKKRLLKLADDGLTALAGELASGRATEAMKTWIKFVGRFSRYSKLNQQLVWAQRGPTATRCAGFQAWKEHGRFVKKGEKGIAIFAPMLHAKRVRVDRNDGVEDEEPVGTWLSYRIVHVFDIAQTDGEPVPINPALNLTAAKRSDLLKVERAAMKLGPLVEVEPSQVRRGILGSTDGTTIWVTKNQGAGARLSSILHEMAHFVLHFDDKRQHRTPCDQRSIEELEAEATSCAIAASLLSLK